MSRVLRFYGRSYSFEDLEGIGKQICKKFGVTYKGFQLNGRSQELVIEGAKNGEVLVRKVPFQELRNYSLVSRSGEKPYYEDEKLVFYRDELEETALCYARVNCGTLDKFNISHKTGGLIVYVNFGSRSNKFDISLYDVDRYLMSTNKF